jgi:thiol-disulfide isomerase/thioredoxin
MSMQNKQSFIILGVAMVFLIAVGAFMYQTMSGPSVASGTYTELAQCIKDSGATFYGAFWCPHCQEQKRLFGDAAELLPYVECSAPNGKDQLEVCVQAGIKSYPTWEFAGGKRTSGAIKLDSLAQLTNCPVPDVPAAEAPASTPPQSN